MNRRWSVGLILSLLTLSVLLAGCETRVVNDENSIDNKLRRSMNSGAGWGMQNGGEKQ